MSTRQTRKSNRTKPAQDDETETNDSERSSRSSSVSSTVSLSKKKGDKGKEPEAGPAPKKTPETLAVTVTPRPALVKASADSSSGSPTREMNVRDWTEFHIDQTRRLAMVFRDHIESINNNCFKIDEHKLEANNSASYTLALGMVRQVHMAIKSHVELLQELDVRMCEEFTEKYPKKINLSFSTIDTTRAACSPEASALMCTSSSNNNDTANIMKTEPGTMKKELRLKKENQPESTADAENDNESEEESDDVYKSALLADSDPDDESPVPSRKSLRPRKELKDIEEGTRRGDELQKKRNRRSIRTSNNRNSVYSDALENLDDDDRSMSPIDEENEDEGRQSTGKESSKSGKKQLVPITKEDEKLVSQKCVVVCEPLGTTILAELGRNKVIRLEAADSNMDEDEKLLLEAIRRRILRSATANSTPKSSKPGGAAVSRKALSTRKGDEPSRGLLSDESDDDVLEGLRSRKEEPALPAIQIRNSNEILSSPETDSDDDEELARKVLLDDDSTEKDKEKVPEKKEKERKADTSAAGSTSGTRLKMPHIGPAIKIADMDSDEEKTKVKRSSGGQQGQKRSSSEKPSTERKNRSHSDSSETQEEDIELKGDKQKKTSPSADKKVKKSENPSKTGMVPGSDTEEDEKGQKQEKEKDKGKGAKTETNDAEEQKAQDKSTSKNKNASELMIVSEVESSDSDAPAKRVLRNAKIAKKTEAEKSTESDSEDSDFIPTKKSKLIKKKKHSSGSEPEILEISSDSEDLEDGKKKGKKGQSSSSTKQKTKKLRRIKVHESSSDDDDVKVEDGDDDGDAKNESQGSGKGRKNIRKLISVADLKVSTKEAAKQEEARKQRLSERQKLYNEIFKPPESDKLKSLVLDFDKNTKEALVSVDPAIVSQLKPHQAKGIQFMWNACFESLEAKKEGGCILAHCMGLGKTLQSVAFVHTVLNNKKTDVKNVLIVCPLNTVENWYTEFRKWTRNAEGRVHLHRLWDEKGSSRFTGLQIWRKHGGAGIIHYEGFRNLLNSDQKKGKQRVPTKCLKIVEETLVNPGPDLVICDEGHLLKNASSLISKAVNKIRTKRRIVLTGTPLQNNLSEYHTMMSFVKPSLLGDIKEFRNRFMNPILNGQHKDSQPYDVVLMKKRAHVLHKLLEGCVQRLDYTVLTPFLPPKFEYAISIDLTEKQKELYEYYIMNLSSRAQGDKFAATKLFTDYTILNKICTHPYVLTYKTRADQASSKDTESEGSLKDFICDDDETTTVDEDSSGNESEIIHKKKKIKTRSTAKDDDEEPAILQLPEENKLANAWYMQFFKNEEEMRKIELSGKFVVLMEILRVAEMVGDKVLIFSQYLTTLDMIEEFLYDMDQEAQNTAKANQSTGDFLNLSGRTSEGRYRPQIDYFRIDGSTKSSSRQDQCDKFNQNLSKAKVFLISIRAGGLGINLHGANRVVIFDASWNPSQDLQAIFRVYRFGQTKPSYIYRLLSRGTMEEKIYNRQVVKLSLSCRVVDEQQIERHYHYDDLQKMYHFDRNDPTERPTPIVPKDKLLAGLLQSHKDWVFSYLEHDSLLENKEEEELSEEAKKLAWEEFNNEGTRLSALSDFTYESLQRFFDSNNSDTTFLGTRDWAVYTMQRLHSLHPSATLVIVGNTVRDIVEILQKLVLNYPIMIGQIPSSPTQRAAAAAYCKDYIQKLRSTYKGTLSLADINYLGPGTDHTPEFIRAILPASAIRQPTNIFQTPPNQIGTAQQPRRVAAQPPVAVANPFTTSFNGRTPMPPQFGPAVSTVFNGYAPPIGTSTPLRQQAPPRASIQSIPRQYVPPTSSTAGSASGSTTPQIVHLDE